MHRTGVNVLLMGGTGQAQQLAVMLHPVVHALLYSSVTPLAQRLRCEQRHGALTEQNQWRSLMTSREIDLVIDATHPYARRVKQHLREITLELAIPYWRLERLPWLPGRADRWRQVATLRSIKEAIAGFRRPFFTIGKQAVKLLPVPATQFWLVRHIGAQPQGSRYAFISGRGPFTYGSEMRLFTQHGIDVLVSKNSGGDATSAKLAVARALKIPVVLLARPDLPPADRVFYDADQLLQALSQQK